MSANQSRRAVLAGAAIIGTASAPAALAMNMMVSSAALAVASPPVDASALNDDPAIRAVERCRRAYEAFHTLCKHEDDCAERGEKLQPAPNEMFRTPAMVSAVTESRAARADLARTAPTSPAGLVAMLAYVREQNDEREEVFFDGDAETQDFIASIERGCRAMVPKLHSAPSPTRKIPPDPIFALIEDCEAALRAECTALSRCNDLKDTLPETETAWFWTVWDTEPPNDPNLSPEWVAAEMALAEAYDRKDEALSALFTMKPTTLRGLSALLSYVGAPEYPEKKMNDLISCLLVESHSNTDEEVGDAARHFLGRLGKVVNNMARAS